jgi:hypothetical protein
MNIEKVEKKVREIRFFLDKMREEERRAFGDREPFDFYLSAFLGAAMTVRGAFHIRQDPKRNAAIKAWKEAWEARLTPEDSCAYEFMRKD